MMNKRNVLIVCLVFVLLFVSVDAAFAQSSTALSFGIRPTKALEGQKETFSYFSFRVSPQTTLEDEALVMNEGGAPITLKIYAADGITSRNGGTDFAKEGGLSEGLSGGVSEWISLSVTEVTLAAGEEKLIPFEVNIPEGVAAGQYVAGLVVEALPVTESVDTDAASGADEAQFAVQVVRRVGVAVVMDVVGTQTASLEVTGISLHEQSEAGAIFAVRMKNTGNTFVTPNGFFVVTDRHGEELLTTVALGGDTILPGDETVFYVARPILFGDGEYLLSALMSYGAENQATLEGVGMSIKDGQPQIEGVLVEEVFSPEEIQQIFEDPAANKNTLLIVFSALGLFLAFGVAGFVYWLEGKKARKPQLVDASR